MSYKRKKVIQALNHFGFSFHHEGGDHTALATDSITIYVPRHKEIGRGLTRTIVKQADLDWQEFKKHL